MNGSAPSRFKNLSPGTRLFLSLRWRLTPYEKMASYLPSDGRILDLGCGHGLLALTLATTSHSRKVVGVDHDDARVEAAKVAAQGLANLQFEQGNVLQPPAGPWNAISLIDVMHYFEPHLQSTILTQAFELLQSGGILILREVDPQGGGLASVFNRFYEKIATTTGFTRAEKPGLHFRTPEQWKALIANCGFEVQIEPCSSRLFADILYICRKHASH